MINLNISNKALAIHLMRISFGINYFFHGLVRLPNLNKFVLHMEEIFINSLIPNFLITPVAYAIPFAEIIIGVLLILNKYTRETIVATFILMNILIIGCCFAQKWDNVGSQTFYLGFLFILLFFIEDKKWNQQSLY